MKAFFVLMLLSGFMFGGIMGIIKSGQYPEITTSDKYEYTVQKSVSSKINNPLLVQGEKIFKAQCNQCHHRDMKNDLTGPALGGVEERWAAYPIEDLYDWIRNSQKMIAEGHPKAVELWNKWNKIIMTSNQLTDEEIQAVLAYIDAIYLVK